METVFWLGEYAKVLFAYGMLMFVWPSVVFRKYLLGKGLTFRFGFCVTVQVVLVNTVILCLGLLHILNAWTVRAFFYGIFLWSVFKSVHIGPGRLERIRRLLCGVEGTKLFVLRTWQDIRRTLRQAVRRIAAGIRPHGLECLVLGVVVVYGMIYFSYGAFRNYSYGFGDMYLHHSWIYSLAEGEIFAGGIYPEAMHCFIYGMYALFGVEIYSCLLFTAGIHVAVFLVAAYVMLRELFHWRYTAVFVLTMFLTVDLLCVDEIFSMSRLQWTLPQEFGLYTQFLCVLYLIRYLKKPLLERKKPDKADAAGKRKCHGKCRVWNGELFLFMMAIAASFVIHTYATMMAFFLCLSAAVWLLHKIFCGGHFRGLAIAVVCGVLIAAAPMGLAFASGIPFQGSIQWAVNIINGTDTKEGRTQKAGTVVQQEAAAAPQEESAAPEPAGEGSGVVTDGEKKSENTIGQLCEKLYRHSYVTLYREERAAWIVGLTLLGAVIFVVYRILALALRRMFRKTGFGKKQAAYLDGYPVLLTASILFMVLYAAPFLGLPELVAGARLCSSGQLLILAVTAIPLDVVFSLLSVIKIKYVWDILSALCVGGIYAAAMYFGVFHGYLYYELTRYNAAVMVTNEIVRNFPENSYTIVSCTDELYQVIEHGYHEELLTFVQPDTGSYVLPTEYIFVYVEKQPLAYAQNHFFTGPDWLAWEKYTVYYTDYFSEGDDVCASEISEQMADEEIKIFGKLSDSYSNLESRTILQSKAYRWCQRFMEMYGNDMHIYYEDDAFVCYLIEQNPYSLFHLEGI